MTLTMSTVATGTITMIVTNQNPRLTIMQMIGIKYVCIIPAYALRFRKKLRLATSQASQSSKKSTISKNRMKPQKTGKEEALQLKMPFMFERFTF